MLEPTVELAEPDGDSQATLVPGVARALLGLAQERGIAPERLCRGLGFEPEDLATADIRVSPQQTRALILRAQRMLKEPALGLVVGARETPISWGLPGLAMLTCETLGEAVQYGLERQVHTGSLMQHQLISDGSRVHLTATAHVFDHAIEAFLVEEAFAGSVAVVRAMVGPSFRPALVELAFSSQGHHRLYERFFACPVRFDADQHHLSFETHWLNTRLPGYDRLTSDMVRQQLNQLLRVPIGRDDLVESVSNRLRYELHEAPAQGAIATQLNVSDRTLRRRLGQRDTNFRALRDATRLERARDLLANSTLSITDVAHALGYADARSFRRAFKRWTGQLPSDLR